MTDQHNGENSGEEPQVVVRDRRRIDPETGEVRPGGDGTAGAAGAAGAAGQAEPAGRHAADEPAGEPVVDLSAAIQAQLDERTADLQRLQAEYANYRKRVDRDREVVATTAKAQIVTDLLSVLDDLERAEAHGDLTGAFKAVAEKLTATLQKTGLEPFGHEGEPFDPSVHEAVQHNTSTEVDGPTVTGVLRRGYRFGDRVVRAALVAVTDAEAGPPPAAAQDQE
ncbi:nucleotide exchange factor GrpE [Actinokineospora iranica]|uniref:Protein GrpE n=1 Tax=Actinokineospora iranica TaxID=1271860 RepID=A0A1G6Q3A1_9PSEU|nr:nucleotide exchange factor GrpE [Actinokineospora iranica]SDC86920.1 molecular chaperone GrpE [Actinokineospora iranica]